MLTPSSRLGDDLYRLYLAGLAWFLLPFYAALLNEVLPSEWSQFDAAFDLAVIAACLLGVWTGLRGGPFMVSRAVILYELGSPVSKRKLLLPWLVRQATAWALAAAVSATALIVLADQESFGYSVAFSTSVAAILAAWSAVFLAASTLVARYQPGQRKPIGSAVCLCVVAVVIAVALGLSMTEWNGIAALALLAAASTVLAAIALEHAPIEPLWRRATAVESMRSSLQQFQFQRVLLDLRNATEQPPYATNTWLSTLSVRLPLTVWRHLAAVQHTLRWHVVRLATFTGALGATLWWGDITQGVMALAIATCALLVGLELSGAVAATSDQLTFVVHYPKRSARILRAQVLTAVVMAAALGSIAVASQISSTPRVVAGVLIILTAGVLGAAMQARLGSPDVAALLDKYGPDGLSTMLWGRALLGPLLVLGTAIAAFHQFLRPEPLADELNVLIAALLLVGFVISTAPIERVKPERKWTL